MSALAWWSFAQSGWHTRLSTEIDLRCAAKVAIGHPTVEDSALLIGLLSDEERRYKTLGRVHYRKDATDRKPSEEKQTLLARPAQARVTVPVRGSPLQVLLGHVFVSQHDIQI